MRQPISQIIDFPNHCQYTNTGERIAVAAGDDGTCTVSNIAQGCMDYVEACTTLGPASISIIGAARIAKGNIPKAALVLGAEAGLTCLGGIIDRVHDNCNNASERGSTFSGDILWDANIYSGYHFG